MSAWHRGMRLPLWGGLIGLLLSAIWVLALATLQGGGAHPRSAACADCHLAGAETTKANAHQLVASQEKLCIECHPKALETSHPTGMSPKGSVPPEYPLDWKGEVTCSTCHQIHGDTPMLIRGGSTGKELCLSCHEATFFTQMTDRGISIQRRGHLGMSGGAVSSLLDSLSRECMACHGDSGDGGMVSINARGVLLHGGGGANHPIGVDYAKASRSASYRPAQLLKKEILLPEGKVACVSCHVVYSKDHGGLVMSNTGSRLCMECHDI